MGSALATTFGASLGQVGRNIYVPIYLYLPLPAKVGDSIYRNIQAKETFRNVLPAVWIGLGAKAAGTFVTARRFLDNARGRRL